MKPKVLTLSKKIKGRVYNSKTGRWRTIWHSLQSKLRKPNESETESENNGIALVSAKVGLTEVKEVVSSIDPLTQEKVSQVKYHYVKSSHAGPSVWPDPGLRAGLRIPDCPTQLPPGPALQENVTLPSSECGLEKGQNSQREKPYAHQRKVLSEAWTSVRPAIERSFYNSQAPASFHCGVCQAESPHILFCADCGPTAYFCESCARAVHKCAVLHVPVRWNGKMYCPYMWNKELQLPNHECLTATVPSDLILIDEEGREHQTVVHFCGCFNKCETLIQLGFWPGSPQTPATAISLRFMEKARSFLLEGAVALQTFCSCVKEYLIFLPTYPSKVDLYRILSRDCVVQHRNFAYDVGHLKEIVEHYPDGSECMICKKTEAILPKIVSMDGNFRLVRKKSSGVSYTQPNHGSRLFIEKEDVQPFLTRPSGTSDGPVNACSDFRAGDLRRSGLRCSKLDVTGIFGSVCIHDYPQKFIDLDAGEKLGYAVCLINRWKDLPGGLKVTYDIACKIKPQLHKAGINDGDIGLAVPLFHGYAHEAKCQVQYNPRLLEHFRNADGENIERLWSYLGQFTYITKEMTASNRRDLLVDALLHYGNKVMRNRGSRLKARMENALNEKQKALVVLDETKELLRAGGLTVDDEVVTAWSKDFQGHSSTRLKTSNGTWQENYATALNTYYAKLPQLVEPAIQKDEIERKMRVQKLEERLRSVEQRHRIKRWPATSLDYRRHLSAALKSREEDFIKRLHQEAVERRHLLLIKRDARGHDTAAKVSKQIRNVNGRIQKLVESYNSLPSVSPLTFDKVKDTDSGVYQGMATSISTPGVPFNLLREAVVSFNKICRCNEEVTALQIEFPALLEHEREVHNLLEESLERDLTPGAKAFIFNRLCENEREQQITLNAIRQSIPDMDMELTTDTTILDHVWEINMAILNSRYVETTSVVGISGSDSEESELDDEDAMLTSDEENDFGIFSL